MTLVEARKDRGDGEETRLTGKSVGTTGTLRQTAIYRGGFPVRMVLMR